MSKKNRINYLKVVPDESFIGRDMAAMYEQETPYSFDFWCAVYLLSTVVGRNVVVPRPRATVHLNMYMILVGASGIVRKSTSISKARRILHKWSVGAQEHAPQIVESRSSPEGLEETLSLQYTNKESKRCYATIIISELSEFLGNQAYLSGMPSLLTDLYDCPSHRKGGRFVGGMNRDIGNVYITMLSASTPVWLYESVNPAVITGGFTSRCLFVLAHRPKRLIAWPNEDINGEEVENSLARELLYMTSHALRGRQLEIEPEAVKFFSHWYSRRTPPQDNLYLESFYSREDMHILRLAGLLAINDDSWVISRKHMFAAKNILTEVRDDAATVFNRKSAISDIEKSVIEVRNRITNAGENGISKMKLTQQVRSKVILDELNVIIEIMHELKMINIFLVKQPNGRPKTVIRATSLINDSDAINSVTSEMIG